ncbi:MAG: protein kinase [Planctomycetota bacterium]|nr:protein kinase [Planctomycetota bacterium]
MSQHPTPDATVFPEILHRYHNVSLIGQGGSGKVYRAQRRDNGQIVAIKVLEFRNKDSIRIKRFRREALAIASLNHQNVVRIHDLDVDSRDGDSSDNPNFLVMDWIEGHDLEIAQIELDQSHDSRLEWLLPVFTQIADALAHAHARGVIHRDLKPANIMIESDTKTPVLIDFGLVKIKTDKLPAYLSNYESLTRTGQALGTPRFMAPEQILGKKDRIDEKADVWGFGSTLYYCLTGSPPYPVNNVLDLFELIHGQDPLRAKQIVPELPPWLDELCARCLTRDSSARPSMKEVLSILKARRMVKPKNTVSYRQVGLVFGVVSAFAMTLALFLDSTPPPELAFKDQSYLTNSKSFTLKTSVVKGRPTVITVFSSKDKTLKEFPVPNDSPEIALPLQLSEGKHRLQVVTKDSKSRESAPVTIEVEVDRSQPDFNFAAVSKVVYDSEFNLKGIVSERNCILTVAGKTVNADEFRFEIPLTLITGDNTITVVCTDPAGNSSRKHLSIRRARNFVIGPVQRLPKDYQRVQSLDEALETAREGERLVLAPGLYKGPILLNKALIIECSDPRRLASIHSDSNVPTLSFQRKGRLTLIGLELSNKAQGPALLSKSPVTLTRCQFASDGQRNVVLELPEKSQSNSVLVDCRFVGRSAIGLAVLSGHVFADRCDWTNQKRSGLLALGRAKVNVQGGRFHSNAIAVSIRGNAQVKLNGCRLEQQKTHGVLIQDQGYLEARDCEILKNGGWAIHGLGGRGKLTRCKAWQNALGGVRIEKDAQIDCWEMRARDNLGPNFSSQLKDGLRIHQE